MSSQKLGYCNPWQPLEDTVGTHSFDLLDLTTVLIWPPIQHTMCKSSGEAPWVFRHLQLFKCNCYVNCTSQKQKFLLTNWMKNNLPRSTSLMLFIKKKRMTCFIFRSHIPTFLFQSVFLHLLASFMMWRSPKVNARASFETTHKLKPSSWNSHTHTLNHLQLKCALSMSDHL